MDAAREVAQLLQGEVRLLARLPHQLGRGGSPLAARCSAIRRFSASATSRCCAPSCRSRSMRRRSASAAAMIRERASWSSVTWAVSTGSAFEPSSCAASQPYRPAERAQRRDADEQDEGSERERGDRLAERVHVHRRDPRPRVQGPVVRGREEQPEPDAQHRHRDRERQDPERQLEQEEREVLPGGRIGQPRRDPPPPAIALGVGPVGRRDLDADRRPISPRSSSAIQRHAHTVPISTGMPISVIAVPNAERDRRDEEAELRHPERQGEQHVEDPPVGAGVEDRSDRRSMAFTLRPGVAQSIRASVPCRAWCSARWLPRSRCSARRSGRRRCRAPARSTSGSAREVALHSRARLVRPGARRGGDTVVRRRHRRPRFRHGPPLPPGRYKVVSYQRPCDGNCSPRPAHRPLRAAHPDPVGRPHQVEGDGPAVARLPDDEDGAARPLPAGGASARQRYLRTAAASTRGR